MDTNQSTFRHSVVPRIADSKAKAKPKASPSRGAWRKEAQGGAARCEGWTVVPITGWYGDIMRVE